MPSATSKTNKFWWIKILYISGYTEGEVLEGVVRGRNAFLQKPFSPSQLHRSLRQLLD